MNAATLAQRDFFDPAILSDPYEFYRRLRRESPVCEVHHPELGQSMFLVTSYALIKEVGSRPEVFSSAFAHVLFGGASVNPEADAIIAELPCEPTFLLTHDDPAHKRRRAIVSGAFTPRMVSELSRSIGGITDSIIDGFIERGECDFVYDFAVFLPTYVIADILGVDRSHYARVTEWSDAIILRVGKMATRQQEIDAARQILDFRRFMLGLIRERRVRRTDDLISNAMYADTNGEPPLSDVELLSFVQEVLVAGNETTRNTLISGMIRFLENPDQLRLLRDDPSLAVNAVEETLRLETPASSMWRIATEETVLGGVRLPKGAVISLRYDSANRDETQFSNPDAFDIRRQNARSHLSFSYGPHHCMGQHLARKELSVAFPKLLTRLKNVRMVAEKTDTRVKPSVLIRARNKLQIAFDPGERQTAAR
jgi:cytochrome P450